MKDLLELVKSFGISIDESAPTTVLLCLFYLIMSSFILLNVINICMYLLSIYIVSHEKFLSKIPAKYIYIHKLIKFYKNIRISFIIFEVILLLICLIIMISLSYGIVSFYLNYINN